MKSLLEKSASKIRWCRKKKITDFGNVTNNCMHPSYKIIVCDVSFTCQYQIRNSSVCLNDVHTKKTEACPSGRLRIFHPHFEETHFWE